MELFPLPSSVTGSCNVGGFGIDGGLSTLVGASLVHPDRLYFGIIGDLAFFYDMNALGNRHIRNNLRLLLVNNGKGQEFRNYQHPASLLDDDCDKYVAAGGHYGKQSPTLVKYYAESMGFRYLTASSKKSFLNCIRTSLMINMLTNQWCLKCLQIMCMRMKHYIRFDIW